MKKKHRPALDVRQTARSKIALGGFSAEAEISVTPKGLLAVGGLVSMILLAVAPIILAAAVKRRARTEQAALPAETPQHLLLHSGERS